MRRKWQRLSELDTTSIVLFKSSSPVERSNRVVEEPLFKSHLFIQIEDHRRDEVFSFQDLRYLFWLRRPAQVPKLKSTIQVVGRYNHGTWHLDIQLGVLYAALWPILWWRSCLLDRTHQKPSCSSKNLVSTLLVALQQRPFGSLIVGGQKLYWVNFYSNFFVYEWTVTNFGIQTNS